MADRWRAWWAEVCAGLDAGCAPGGAVWIGHRGEVVLHACHGHAQLEPAPDPLRLAMWFDLASVTKAVSTTAAALALVDQGRLDLDAPAAEHLPELAEHGKGDLTARMLLTHTAGFAPFVQYFRQQRGREAMRAAVLSTPLSCPPRTACTYSDIGFLTLGFLIEAISGQRQDAFVRDRVHGPLGLHGSLGYLPARPEQCVATERCSWRGEVVRGRVHDENADACGGVAGHAGLFGTVAGVGRYAQAVMEGRVWSPAVQDEIFRIRDDVAGERFWLGFKRLTYETDDARAFGHDGFTGNVFWVSPRLELVVALLTNRVHPTRDNRMIYEHRPRWIHEAAVLAGA